MPPQNNPISGRYGSRQPPWFDRLPSGPRSMQVPGGSPSMPMGGVPATPPGQGMAAPSQFNMPPIPASMSFPQQQMPGGMPNQMAEMFQRPEMLQAMMAQQGSQWAEWLRMNPNRAAQLLAMGYAPPGIGSMQGQTPQGQPNRAVKTTREFRF